MTKMTRACMLAVAAMAAASAARAQTAPTFSKDVAPILYSNCVVCHRPGEVAPMSLITYQNVRPWARAIKNKVVGHEMPPWGASPASMKLANDRSLSQKDIDTIVKWADSGAPQGDDKDLPAVPAFPAGGWAFGEPDAVVDLPRLMGNYDWRFSERNLWKVEQALIDYPHHRIVTSKARVDRWRRKYRAFREQFPDRKPLFYPRRERWTPLPQEFLR